MIATLLLAIVTALGLVFDPRYRDFPFAPLTAVAVPFLTHSLVMPRPAGQTRALPKSPAPRAGGVGALYRAQ